MRLVALTADPLTATQIVEARTARLIDRETYQDALYGDGDAIERVVSALKEQARREFVEEVTP